MKHISIDKESLIKFCRENGIQKFALFGSILTDDFRPDSDIDVLIDFNENIRMDLFKFVRLAREISEQFFDNRRVDLVTYKGLRPLLRDGIIKSSEVQYEEVA